MEGGMKWQFPGSFFADFATYMNDSRRHLAPNAAALRSIALKTVPASDRHDTSTPLTSCYLDNSKEVEEYTSTVLEANIEHWYTLLGTEITFKTEFVPLTIDDAKFIVSAVETMLDRSQPLSEEQQEYSAMLEAKVDAAIQRIRGDSDMPVFVKLSSRSAKDAPVTQQRLITLFEEYLSQQCDDSMNSRIAAILRAGTELLKAYKAKDALDLFYHSNRAKEDMELALDNLHKFHENVIIRNWVDFDPMLEFRGFVHGCELRCMSQYNHLVKYPTLIEEKTKIEALLRTFFDDQVAPKIRSNFDDCIVDFGLEILANGQYRPWVIELNPFLPSTDAALFSWSTDCDILENGPFEFRIQERIVPSAETQMKIEWRDIIHK